MTRWDLAERIQEWVPLIALNAEDRLARCIVLGHEARQYQVWIDCRGNVLRLMCRSVPDNVSCKSNTCSVCCHALAVVLHAILLQGLDVTLYDTPAEAGAAAWRVVRVACTQVHGEQFLSVKQLK